MAEEEFLERQIELWLAERYTPEFERLLIEKIGQPANDDWPIW